MKQKVLLTLAVLTLMAAAPSLFAQGTKTKLSTDDKAKIALQRRKAPRSQFTSKELIEFKKIDAYFDSIASNIVGGSAHGGTPAILLAQGIRDFPCVTKARYLREHANTLSSEEMHAIMVSIFDDEGELKIKGFDPEAYYRGTPDQQKEQQAILNRIAQKEHQRMAQILSKREKNEKEFQQKKSKLAKLRGDLNGGALTSNGEFPWHDSDKDFFEDEQPGQDSKPAEDIKMAQQGGHNPTVAQQNAYYSAYWDAKNAYNKDQNEKSENKDVDQERFKAFTAGVQELGACLDCKP